MGAWIVGGVMASMAAITGLSVGVALRLHFLHEHALAECAMLLDYALDMDDRCVVLQAMVNDPPSERLATALHESEHELERCEHERQMLRLRLAEALSKPRTVPIKRADATKPRPPQKSQEKEP